MCRNAEVTTERTFLANPTWLSSKLTPKVQFSNLGEDIEFCAPTADGFKPSCISKCR